MRKSCIFAARKFKDVYTEKQVFLIKKKYADNSTISKKGKEKDDFPEQVKSFGRLSAKARCLLESLHHNP